ncbi:alpha/beta fold hydrolase [Synechococcales cyanobacterium C]|uniref:Alpha/beta fold hydrolase n=1 Tax=Petrachloros mirabilis ULC683 TaxID=2781853 RepID=A0A8K1ZXP3_9CYAN|nr:alpha/beta fold hydrolase [Petrachloros mirabilis]NCJ05798.1 alpha/beta fold hydrolase [Petrachloros mirabilis ULC683]
MATSTSSVSSPPREQHLSWNWQNQTILAAYERFGVGSPVILLPALSTVSTRQEFSGVAQRLVAAGFQGILVDWPGFGESDRGDWGYTPAFYRQFILALLDELGAEPVTLVAAGHGAGYALYAAQQLPNRVSQVAVVAPTWRGPFTAMGLPVPIAQGVQALVRSPLLGDGLYALNTLPDFLKFMYERHVFTDATRLTPDFIAAKRMVTQKEGAKYGPAAFVTGGLDPVTCREDFLALARSVSQPMLALLAEQAPPQSKAEMAALGTLPQVRSQWLPGSLGLHEEFAPVVATALLNWLSDDPERQA